MGKKSKGKDKKRDRGRDATRLGAEDWSAGTSLTGASATRVTAGVIPGFEALDASPSSRQAAQRLAVDATELAARLASLSTVLLRHLSRADTGDGLTRARLSALALLVLGGPRTLGELAAAEHVRPPTMTRLVHAMEADGLVVRERHPSDGRSIIIRPTSSGEAQLAVGRARQIAPLADSIAELGGPERKQLEAAADLLGRVLREASWEAIEAER